MRKKEKKERQTEIDGIVRTEREIDVTVKPRLHPCVAEGKRWVRRIQTRTNADTICIFSISPLNRLDVE